LRCKDDGRRGGLAGEPGSSMNLLRWVARA